MASTVCYQGNFRGQKSEVYLHTSLIFKLVQLCIKKCTMFILLACIVSLQMNKSESIEEKNNYILIFTSALVQQSIELDSSGEIQSHTSSNNSFALSERGESKNKPSLLLNIPYQLEIHHTDRKVCKVSPLLANSHIKKDKRLAINECILQTAQVLQNPLKLESNWN